MGRPKRRAASTTRLQLNVTTDPVTDARVNVCARLYNLTRPAAVRHMAAVWWASLSPAERAHAVFLMARQPPDVPLPEDD